MTGQDGGTMNYSGQRVLVSVLCHPKEESHVLIPEGQFEVEINRTEGYANAVNAAIRHAIDRNGDLVLCDADGYHPGGEIASLATMESPSAERVLVKPYRRSIGIQSKAFSKLWSLLSKEKVRDVTGGMYRMSLGLLKSLPELRSKDMTIHLEILDFAVQSGARIVQYPYTEARNSPETSHRTNAYQWKLFKAWLKRSPSSPIRFFISGYGIKYGGTGVVNALMIAVWLFVLTGILGMPLFLSTFFAVLTSIFTDFLWKSVVVFRTPILSRPRFWKYFLTASVATAIQYVLTLLLAELVFYSFAYLVAVGAGFLFAFTIARLHIWKR